MLTNDPVTGQRNLDGNTRRFLYMSVGETIEYVESHAPVSGIVSSRDTKVDKWTDNMSLDQYLKKCKHGDFPEEISKLIELSEEIFKALPKGKTYRRVKEVGMAGSKVRATAVTSGNLSRAFSRTRREKALGNLGVITLVFSAAYSYGHTKAEIRWKTATMLALGLYIDQQGRQSEIWGSSIINNCYTSGASNSATLVRAKGSGMPFDLHEMACLISPAFLRRLLFAVMERLGDLHGGYGIPPCQADFEGATLALFREHKIPSESVLFGPSGKQGEIPVNSLGSAVGWIVDTLKKVEVV